MFKFEVRVGYQFAFTDLNSRSSEFAHICCRFRQYSPPPLANSRVRIIHDTVLLEPTSERAGIWRRIRLTEEIEAFTISRCQLDGKNTLITRLLAEHCIPLLHLRVFHQCHEHHQNSCHTMFIWLPSSTGKASPLPQSVARSTRSFNPPPCWIHRR